MDGREDRLIVLALGALAIGAVFLAQAMLRECLELESEVALWRRRAMLEQLEQLEKSAKDE
jgi:hypothetical protein